MGDGVPGLAGLTPREREIVAVAASGAPLRDLADQLGISPRTVETHLVRCYRKLGLRSRGELIALALTQAAGPAPPPADSREGGVTAGEPVRRTVHVLLCDLGATAQGGTDPELARLAGTRRRDEVCQLVRAYGGRTETYPGDVVLGVFGVLAAHDDDAYRAARTALEIRERLAPSEAAQPGLTPRLGVATGEDLVGPDGGLVSGHTVAVAARLAQAADPGEILLDPATASRAGPRAATAPARSVAGAAIAGGVSAVRLLGVSGGPARTSSATPLVGRDVELHQLRRAFRSTVDSAAGQLVTVVGEAGVGKTRLVEEFVARLGDRARVVRGRCLPYGEGITYWPVREIAQQLAGVPLSEPVRAPVAALLGVGPPRPVEEFGWALRKLLEAAAGGAPVVAVVDDIQWGEPALLDMVEQLVALARAPILVICLARPELAERRPTWPPGLAVEPLGRADARLLLSSRLGGRPVDRGLAERILDAAGGNPLFLEEITETADTTPDGSLRVPSSVHAALAARLDQLPAAERYVLELGAVEGEVFHLGGVQAMAGGDRPVLGPLASAVRRGLLRPVGAALLGEEAFRFRHLLLRDVAYASLAKETRARLHARLATWLEHAAGGAGAEVDALIGHHHYRAWAYDLELGFAGQAERRAPQAAHWLAWAGTAALRRDDAAAARTLLRSALTVLPDGAPERAELLLALGEALWAGLDGEAYEVLVAAAAAAREHGDEGVQAAAWINAAVVAAHLRPADGAEQLARAEQRWLPVAERAGHARASAAGYLALGVHQYYAMDARATDTLELALAHARVAGDAANELLAALWLSNTGFTVGEPAAAAARRLRAMAERSASHAVRARLLDGAAMVLAEAGDKAAAVALTAQTGSVFAELGAGWQLTFHEYFVQARVEELVGDPARAEALRAEGAALLAERGETYGQSVLLAHQARLLCQLGRYAEAGPVADRCAQLCDPRDLRYQAEWRASRARAHAHTGDLEAARRLSEEALRISDSGSHVDVAIHVREAAADVLACAGEIRAACDQLEAAVRLADAAGFAANGDRLRRRLGDLAPAATAASAS